MLNELLTLTNNALHAVIDHHVEDHVADFAAGEENISKESTTISSDSTLDRSITTPNTPYDHVKIEEDPKDIGLMTKDCKLESIKESSKPLIQGHNLSNESDSASSYANDVIAERFRPGERQRIFGKLHSKKHQTQGKVIQPTVIREFPITTTTSQVNSTSAELVSSAVQPFIQIQNALENQITNMVSTLQNAHSAEKQFLQRSELTRQKLKEEQMLDKLNDLSQQLNNLTKNTHYQCVNTDQTNTGNTTRENKHHHSDSRRLQTPPFSDETLTQYHPSYHPSYHPANEEIPGYHGQKNKGILYRRQDRVISQRKDKLKSRAYTKPQMALLQTPVPRREPPKPSSRSPHKGRGAVSSVHTGPRISGRGLALLQEIMADEAAPTVNQILSNRDIPPRSDPTPLLRDSSASSDATRTTIDDNDIQNIREEVQHIMKGTSFLKNQLKEINEDMVANIPKDDVAHKRLPLLTCENPTVEMEELKEHSLSEECPLDKYLKHQRKVIVEDSRFERLPKENTTERGLKVLRETQEAKERLEQNLNDVTRKHKELDLFGYLNEPRDEREQHLLRIKKEVALKIDEIQNNVKTTLQNPSNGKITSSNRKDNRLPLSATHKTELKSKFVEKTANKIVKPTKLKIKKKKELVPPPESSTAYDELIYQHIYGRQPHQPHRHMLQNEKLQICSTRKTVNQKSHNSGQPVGIPQSMSINDQVRMQREQFYFHPHMHDIKNRFPVTGELFATAIPLAEPSQDPAERLPLVINETKPSDETKVKQTKLTKTGPNVAVINMKSQDFNEPSLGLKQRIRTKMKEQLKKKLQLRHQSLPNIDIDTSEATLTSEASVSKSSLEKSAPERSVESVDEKQYKFQEFISVQDKIEELTQSDTIDNEHEEPDKEQPLAISGSLNANVIPQYQGPVFPPQQYKQDMSLPNGVQTLSTLEEKAQEWLEQELLARIISTLHEQPTDPTLKETADSVPLHDVNNDDDDRSSFAWLESVIGLQGIQLFVDAGIPVDQDLVRELIRCVILERLNILFGYPQPLKEEQRSESLNNEDETKEDKALIATPCQTPVTSFVSDGGVRTPEDTISELEEQNIDETVHLEEVKEDEKDISYPLVATPLPSVSEQDSTSSETVQIDTPISWQKDGSAVDNVLTPDRSYVDVTSHVELGDFAMTEPSSPGTEDGTQFTRQDLEQTPVPATRISNPPSPSTPSTTLSSLTAVGTSTFDGISVGEHLHPSQATTYNNGSEGELGGVPLALCNLKSVDEIEDQFLHYDQDTQGTQIKLMMKEILDPHRKHRNEVVQAPEISLSDLNNNGSRSDGEIFQLMPLRSLGEVITAELDHGNKEGNSLEQDTLDEISIEQNLVPQILPNNQKVPFQTKLVSTRQKIGPSDKSEGEVSWFRLGDKNTSPSISVDNNYNDTLSIGQLGVTQPEEHLAPTATRSVLDRSLTSREELVQSNTGRFIVVEARTDEQTKSEGEIIRSESLADQTTNENGLNEDKFHMVLKLPEVNDDVSEYSEEDLSHLNLSTLSGGEL